MQPYSKRIKKFIDNVNWAFAKTMPEWPHEYIVKNKVDQRLFIETVRHIREFGYKNYFYDKPLTYFEEDSLIYWTMGAPINETTIINRCTKENTYKIRLKNGTLPKIKK